MMHLDRSFAVMMIGHLRKDYFESIILGKVFTIYESFFKKHNKLPNRAVVESITTSLGIDKKRLMYILTKFLFQKKK